MPWEENRGAGRSGQAWAINLSQTEEGRGIARVKDQADSRSTKTQWEGRGHTVSRTEAPGAHGRGGESGKEGENP